MCQSFKFRNYFQGDLKFNLNFFAFDLEQNESPYVEKTGTDESYRL